MAERVITMADFKVRAGLWVCRWCRAKALRICDIGHEEWRRLLKEGGTEHLGTNPETR